MARSDLLISLIRAGTRGDQAMFRKTTEALIAEERAKKHEVLAKQLSNELGSNGLREPSNGHLIEFGSDLISEVIPRRRLDDLLLPSSARAVCDELVEEHHRHELLRSHALEPRHRILLAGPPGNGKTSLAEAVAYALAVPMLVVRYEGVIGSYLGETAQRLRRLFDLSRQRHCVLFFDEFDAIGKERGDEHETGEIKRVVSSLLLQIDALPSHTVVIVASNHPELLDRAVWRRFQLRLELPMPTLAQITMWLERFQERSRIALPAPADIARRLNGASFAEVEEFATDVLRRCVLAEPEPDAVSITATRLEQWETRFGSRKQRARRR